jgi:hypothetical protein
MSGLRKAALKRRNSIDSKGAKLDNFSLSGIITIV